MKMLFIAALLAASPQAVAAGTPLPHAAVATADLDLATAAGRATLDRRLDAAVRSVCAGPAIGFAYPPAMHGTARCRAETAISVAKSRDRLLAAAGAPAQLAAQ